MAQKPAGDRLRPIDYFFIIWFVIAFFVCLFIDAEQVTVQNINDFDSVYWPPKPFIQVIHWWGHQCDPALLARSPEYQIMIWIDLVYFLPFYPLGIHAVLHASPWLRDHLLLQSASIITTTTTILSGNLFGPNPSPRPLMLLAGYLPYVLVPVFCIGYCLSRKDIFEGRIRDVKKMD